jgi:trimethylamine--corrinoid protein Co-methyltransferase
MGHFYHLPVNVYGFSTNDHTPGFQSGYERALNAMIPALAGADELSGFGEMEAGVLSSSVQIVLDDELAASVRRTLRGVTVDEETLAVPVIAEAMAGSRNFLTARHTLTHLRGGGELLATQLAERGGWDDWDRGGRRGMVEHAQAKVEKLLAEHHVPALTGDQERALDEIMAAADTALRP